MSSVQAAELRAIAGIGMASPLQQIAAAFEAATGHRIAFRFGTTPELIAMAIGGRPFDLAIVPQEVVQDGAARAQLAPGPTLDIGKVGIGVAVRRGAPRPDISTVEALKETLLAARSIASIPASATGMQLAGIYEGLGIAEAMRARTKAQPGPVQVVEAVASGDAELAVFLLNVISHPSLDVVGPFPPEIQRGVVYTAGLSADVKEPDAAEAFITYLKGPAAAAVIEASGLSPC